MATLARTGIHRRSDEIGQDLLMGSLPLSLSDDIEIVNQI